MNLTKVNFCSMEELNFGPNTMVHMVKHNSELDPTKIAGFREHCLVYMVELVSQIRSRIDHKYETLKALSLLYPEIALGGERDSIVSLTSRFSHLLGETKLQQEKDRSKLDELWNSISEEKEYVTRLTTPGANPFIFVCPNKMQGCQGERNIQGSL
jgi:hypothetical protein